MASSIEEHGTSDWPCSWCGSHSLGLLGELGQLLWMRCRDCGSDVPVDALIRGLTWSQS